MEIAVFGSPQFALGFKLAGVKRTYEVEDDDPALQDKLLGLLGDDSIGVLIVSDIDIKGLPKATKHLLADNVRPVVIPVGKEDEGDIRERIKRAVGIDLYARK